ncbi:MAG: sn-glycerol-1-phosphate dehydrogenase [Defluviitaleaceae bacterium]|nr:sn-glycerol-1-phosphate dehydrogenase [Defluviitaleaceae bacterium]MCL2836505.1 sn-glycerol-1-phosphate dehydrogenase [Defluviitaleaceae bacterium]
MGRIDWSKYTDIIGHIEISEDILTNIPGWIKAKGYDNVLVVQDINTHEAAGARICVLLKEAGIGFDEFVYADGELKADEAAIDALSKAVLPQHNLLLGVGSGTITDLCKYVGHKTLKPCVIAATAPSMDGYASKGAAMTILGMKITPQTICPEAVFCDITVMKDAPMIMFASGLGDMLGKYSAMADWELSHILTGEPMPPEIYGMMSEALRLCAESAGVLQNRDIQAVTRLTEGLVLSGIAMSLYGDSRPASGTEHHLSHYWEMRRLAEHKKPVAHGLSVGVGALCALTLWKSLPVQPERPGEQDRAWIEGLVASQYGNSAPELLKTQNPNLPYDLILEKWAEIKEIARKLPEPGDVAELLKTVGAPVSPCDVSVDSNLLRESILLARERKKVYTVLQLLGDLNLLEKSPFH